MSSAWRSFEDLECWQACRELRLHVQREIVPRLPREEAFRLKDQILRSSRSSTANIAEGYGRYHYMDKARFFGNARGSCCETLDHAIVAADSSLVGPDVLARTRGLVERSVLLINGYMRYLRESADDSATGKPGAVRGMYTREPEADSWSDHIEVETFGTESGHPPSSPVSRLPTPDSRPPTPDSPLPSPDSRLPTPAPRPRSSTPKAKGSQAMHRPSRAFTLIEMLVVMGIIGILVALLFPAIRGAQLAADRADTERLTIAFEGAMKSFYNEYGRFPFQGNPSYGSPNIDKYYLIDDVTYTNLVACLRGLNVTENPKNIPFLDVPEKKLGEYKTLKSVLLDPWDSPFRVWADWSNNNEINTATPGNVYEIVRGRQVLIWSPGPDRQDGSSSARSNRDDNVTSWGG
jgi:four helix bundle protein